MDDGELVEVRIESLVMDLFLVVLLELVVDRESVWFVLLDDRIQRDSLETSQIARIGFSVYRRIRIPRTDERMDVKLLPY